MLLWPLGMTLELSKLLTLLNFRSSSLKLVLPGGNVQRKYLHNTTSCLRKSKWWQKPDLGDYLALCDNGLSNKVRIHHSEKPVSETVLDLLSANKVYVSGNSLAIISCLTKGQSPLEICHRPLSWCPGGRMHIDKGMTHASLAFAFYTLWKCLSWMKLGMHSNCCQSCMVHMHPKFLEIQEQS